MLINYQKNHIGMLAVVFSLMAITLYMAFAFPYSLLHFKQSETTELRAVIIIGRHGEVTPNREAYFDTHGEEPPQAWFELGGPDQLTNTGKERMYLLGKFLRLHYYERLLQGNPRRLYVRSENSDKTQESAQALLAGLNPPRDKWTWHHDSDSNAASEFASSWQPKAINSMPAAYDDLLSSQSKCLQMDSYRAGSNWKNSTRYLQLLNEFRHDLQILRQNTGLDFEDDLEMLANIESQLRARSSFDSELEMPSWYTSTLAQRLAHIADVTAGCRFSQVSSQRLYVGRLLDTVVTNIFAKIRSDLTSGVSLLNDDNDSKGANDITDRANDNNADSPAPTRSHGSGQSSNLTNSTSMRYNTEVSSLLPSSMRGLEPRLTANSASKLLPPDEQVKLKLERQMEPSMFIYMTDKQHLTALLNSLKIYSSQPHYGALLMIELHYDPANQIHFLRLFTVNSASHNVFPEPVRVNPIACLDTVECSPQQFKKNIRHLTLDKSTWQSLCSNVDKYDTDQLLQPISITTTTPAPLPSGFRADPPNQTTASPLDLIFNSSNKTTTVVSDDKNISDNELDNILSPTEQSGARPTSAPIGGTSTSQASTAVDDVNDSIHLDKLDESLIVGPITTTTESSLNGINQEFGPFTTEQIASESATESTASDSGDSSQPTTTTGASSIEAESTTDTITKPTNTTTDSDAAEVTTMSNESSSKSLAAGADDIATTTPAPTLLDSWSSVLNSLFENDPKVDEMIDENHLLAQKHDNTSGESDN